MSYAMQGLGAAVVSNFGLTWKDSGGGQQSAAVQATGPVCGYQIASQVMLHDLGFGAGKSNQIDPDFPNAFHAYAVARKLVHAEGSPVTDEMCRTLLGEWQTLASPTPTNPNLWQFRGGITTEAKLPPAPGGGVPAVPTTTDATSAPMFSPTVTAAGGAVGGGMIGGIFGDTVGAVVGAVAGGIAGWVLGPKLLRGKPPALPNLRMRSV